MSIIWIESIVLAQTIATVRTTNDPSSDDHSNKRDICTIWIGNLTETARFPRSVLSTKRKNIG